MCFYQFSQKKAVVEEKKDLIILKEQHTFFSLGLHVNIDSKVVIFCSKMILCRIVNKVSYSRQQNTIHRKRERHCLIWYLLCHVISTPLTPRVIFFCRVSASKCSKLWALTLTLCRALSQWEALRHHRMPWTVCTNCPPWSHSCSRPSAGISAHSYHCCQSTHTDRHSTSLPVSRYVLCVSFILSLIICVHGLVSAMNHMTACMWREVSCGDEPRKNYHRLCSSHQFIVLVSNRQFYCFVSLTGLIVLFLATEGSCFLQIGFYFKTTAEEPEICLRSWWKTET